MGIQLALCSSLHSYLLNFDLFNSTLKMAAIVFSNLQPYGVSKPHADQHCSSTLLRRKHRTECVLNTWSWAEMVLPLVENMKLGGTYTFQQVEGD